MHFSKILIVTDFSPASRAAFDLAAYDKKMDGCEVILLHVHKLSEDFLLSASESGVPIYLDEQNKLAMKFATDNLTKFSNEYFHGQDVRLEVVETYQDVAKEICLFAEKEGCDMIMMGSRGHTSLGALFVGSVTQRVMLLSKCPILIVPPVKSSEEK